MNGYTGYINHGLQAYQLPQAKMLPCASRAAYFFVFALLLMMLAHSLVYRGMVTIGPEMGSESQISKLITSEISGCEDAAFCTGDTN